MSGRQSQRSRAGLLAGLAVLVADQASKWWILQQLDLPDRHRVDLLPVLSLTWVENTGVTFGMFRAAGGWGPVLLAAIAFAIVAGLIIWLRRAETLLVALSLGAIAGGAIGNVVDRLRFGWVEDFIHVHVGTWSWYVFNVADAAIVCGVAALVVDGMRPRPRRSPADEERLAARGTAEL